MKNTKTSKLSKSQVEFYRSGAMNPKPEEWTAGLDQCATHREYLEFVMKDKRLAHGAETLWLVTAAGYAIIPTETAAQAFMKTSFLRASLDLWIIPEAHERGHAPSAAVLQAAIEAEEARWQHSPSTTQRPN